MGSAFVIIFILVPGFYAAVEEAEDPTDSAVIVGGNPRKGGTVTRAGPRAEDAGVVPGLDVRPAQALCPGAILRPTRLPHYREVAAQIRSHLRTHSDRLEPLGLDGCYLEAPSGRDHLTLAAAICVEIKSKFGLTARAGIGPTRFVAQLAGLHAGEAGIREVHRDDRLTFLGPFGVTEIWGLGPATADKLRDVGIESISELRQLSVSQLEAVVGARNAGTFLELAHGRDRSRLTPAAPIKSLSREQTLATASNDLETLSQVIDELSQQVAALLGREQRAARTVTLGVTFIDGDRVSRSRTLEAPLAASAALAGVSLELLARTQAGVRAVRRLRVQATKLLRAEGTPAPEQLRLF